MLKITKKFLWNLTDDDDEKLVSSGGGSPATIYSASPDLTDTDPGNVTTTFRIKVPVTGAGLTQIRATIKPGLTGGDLTILGLGFGKWDSSVTNSPNTLAPIVEGKFSGVSGFVAKTTEQTCDWTDIPSLGLGAGDYLIVSLCTGGSTHCTLAYNASQPAGVVTYYDPGDSWATQNVSGLFYSDLPLYNFGLVSVETQ